MKKKDIGIFKIAATYIGTIVGAGFASGQEVLQFFGVFGIKGLWGLLLATALFFFFGYTVLLIGHKLRVRSHMEVIRYSSGRILGGLIDLIITVFLFRALSAMIAGAGALFKEQFHLSPLIGTPLMAIITFITVITGISGVISAISTVVPFLLIAVLLVAVYTLVSNPISAADLQMAGKLQEVTPHWAVSAVNYVSYNLIIAVPVLSPMGSKVKAGRSLLYGALLGGLGLGIGVASIYLAILTDIARVGKVEIPMIFIAANFSGIIQLIYSVVLFAEVYTTAVGNLYGFTARVTTFEHPYIKWIIAGIAILSFVVSQFGFSTLVKYLYPLVGYGGFVMLLGLTGTWLFKKK
mgnify:CR=1 FL=1